MKLSDFINKLNSNEDAEKDALIFAVKYSRKTSAKDIHGFGKLTEKTFYEAKELQRIFTSSFDESLKAALERTGDKDPELFSFFAFYNYIREEVIRLNEIEKALSHYPSVDEERAGIERFNKYGYFGQIKMIAKEFGWSLEYVKDLPYETAFTILLYNKDTNDFDRDLTKIKSK